MKKIFAVFLATTAFSCAALDHEVTDFWDTTAYQNAVTSSESATHEINYDGVLKTIVFKVCDLFGTFPIGLWMSVR